MINLSFAKITAAICYGIAALIAALPLIETFWPSVIATPFVSYFFGPLLYSKKALMRLTKCLYFAVIIPCFGLLLGGVFVAVLSFFEGNSQADFSSIVGSQLAFGSLGAIWIIPLAVLAYFAFIVLNKRCNDI